MPETMSFGEAISAALRAEMTADPRVFLMGEDIGHYGGVFRLTKGFIEEFGAERVRDTPISEAGFVGAAVGAAMLGWRPVVELMYVDFFFVAADAILNQAAKMRAMSGGQVSVPMVVRTQQGGGRGNGAQHSQSMESLFVHMPGLKVVQPATAADAYGLLRSAIRDDNPVVFLEHKLLYATRGPAPKDDSPVPLGKGRIHRAGSDVTICATGRQVSQSLEAAEALQAEGISVEVWDPRTLSPFDWDGLLESVGRTNRLVVAHEAHRTLGIGAEVAARVQELAFDHLDGPVLRVTGADQPVPYALVLESSVLPDAGSIAATVRRSLNR